MKFLSIVINVTPLALISSLRKDKFDCVSYRVYSDPLTRNIDEGVMSACQS